MISTSLILKQILNNRVIVLIQGKETCIRQKRTEKYLYWEIQKLKT